MAYGYGHTVRWWSQVHRLCFRCGRAQFPVRSHETRLSTFAQACHRTTGHHDSRHGTERRSSLRAGNTCVCLMCCAFLTVVISSHDSCEHVMVRCITVMLLMPSRPESGRHAGITRADRSHACDRGRLDCERAYCATRDGGVCFALPAPSRAGEARRASLLALPATVVT